MATMLKCPDCGEIFDSVDDAGISMDDEQFGEVCPACGFPYAGMEDEMEIEDETFLDD